MVDRVLKQIGDVLLPYSLAELSLILLKKNLLEEPADLCRLASHGPPEGGLGVRFDGLPRRNHAFADLMKLGLRVLDLLDFIKKSQVQVCVVHPIVSERSIPTQQVQSVDERRQVQKHGHDVLDDVLASRGQCVDAVQGALVVRLAGLVLDEHHADGVEPGNDGLDQLGLDVESVVDMLFELLLRH